MLVLLDFRVDLVEGGVGGVLTTRYPDVDQPLLIQVVTKNVGWIRKQLQVYSGWGEEGKGRERKKEREIKSPNFT